MRLLRCARKDKEGCFAFPAVIVSQKQKESALKDKKRKRKLFEE
jgi:hypothetical protein